MAGALWGLATEVRSYFSLSEEVNTDNYAFKLVTKVSVGFCILAGEVLVVDEVFDQKIVCQVGRAKIDVTSK